MSEHVADTRRTSASTSVTAAAAAALALAAACWVVSVREMNGMTEMGVATRLGSLSFFVGCGCR